ncbi:TPA: type II toxin-antitoxin system VapC family toxin [Pseudomonas aeruginosa]|uniref:type II toxin-antitoxin system VapC family toxin n=1 Tax=Pseudomonas aeruginosa TaxID=287 RepID=UPI00053E657F|nr:type II toxin-antitoxin system VapC family toxin [Pseudomonas aeruginosa]AON05419.1 twitching motility protein PilT [Pseudomonas aeruginosa]AON11408.1 twitching motility protein PilT [Pseudomonas aeruginosa]AON17396.1 twitching motility protein PilT [Pseudomonas aeruginosa]AON23919.1 twitching motility protein PilT [Pseudomonas aeruginosa]AON29391.1 twitching motility protein PilT [Pseudomonas aeruginosa]
MKIVIDTNVLVQIMQDDGATDLMNPETGEVVDDAFRRAVALVEQIETMKGTVILPAPVVSEYLLGIERSSYQTHLDIINSAKSIEVVPFDQLAAVECALLVTNQELKNMDPDAKMAKLKYDRQILAIAVASGAKEIWTHDKQLFKRARAVGITPKSLSDILPRPVQLHFHDRV